MASAETDGLLDDYAPRFHNVDQRLRSLPSVPYSGCDGAYAEHAGELGRVQ